MEWIANIAVHIVTMTGCAITAIIALKATAAAMIITALGAALASQKPNSAIAVCVMTVAANAAKAETTHVWSVTWRKGMPAKAVAIVI